MYRRILRRREVSGSRFNHLTILSTRTSTSSRKIEPCRQKNNDDLPLPSGEGATCTDLRIFLLKIAQAKARMWP